MTHKSGKPAIPRLAYVIGSVGTIQRGIKYVPRPGGKSGAKRRNRTRRPLSAGRWTRRTPPLTTGVNGGGMGDASPPTFWQGDAMPLIPPCCDGLVSIITMSHSTECGLSFFLYEW